ncbi:uncharacterized protein [Diadema antillarum]|uniref:uncharacterized protein n=1 Tax=Diadema antillarum TaxID=105358 RepID=UPI003A87C10D
MSENDPRRHLINKGIYTKRKGSMPASASSKLPPSPLAATTVKPSSTLHRQNSDQSTSVSLKNTTPRTSAEKQTDISPSKRTNPASSSPRNTTGASKQRAKPRKSSTSHERESDRSDTATPDFMIRPIHTSQESLDGLKAPVKPVTRPAPGRKSSQEDDPSVGPPAGEGFPKDAAVGTGTGRSDADGGTLLFDSGNDTHTGDNIANAELESRNHKNVTKSGNIGRRKWESHGKGDIGTFAHDRMSNHEDHSQRTSRRDSSRSDHVTSPVMSDASHHLSNGFPEKDDVLQDEVAIFPTQTDGQEGVHRQSDDNHSSQGINEKLEVIDLERDTVSQNDRGLYDPVHTEIAANEADGRRKSEVRNKEVKRWSGSEVAGDGDRDRRKSKVVEHDNKDRGRSEVIADEDSHRRGSEATGYEDRQRRRSGVTEDGDRQRKRSEVAGNGGRQRKKSSEGLHGAGHGESRGEEISVSPRRTAEAKEESPRDDNDVNVPSPSPRSAESVSPRVARSPTVDKMQRLKKRNAELAVMAKRLEEKAKEMQRRPSGSQWKRPPADNTSLVPKGALPHTNHEPLASPTSPPVDGGGGGGVSGQGGPQATMDVDQLKRMMVKQRARELAETAQKALMRDREVETLKQGLDALKKEVELVRQDGLFQGDLQRSLPATNSSLKLKALEEANSALQENSTSCESNPNFPLRSCCVHQSLLQPPCRTEPV